MTLPTDETGIITVSVRRIIMRFSLNFIKEFLEVKVSPNKLAHQLTMVGMEVENFEKVGNDWIFDIEVTSNRYDWLSILGIVREIAPFAHKIIVTKPKFERAAEMSVIEAEVRKYSDDVVAIESVAEAIKHAQDNATNKDVLCVCGSIFNVGEAMEVLGIGQE